MSLGEADAKFPNQGSGLPPSPTRENPGQVFPKSDPKAARPGTVPGAGRSNSSHSALIGNPFLMRESFAKIDRALGECIDVLEREEVSVGGSASENELLTKFRTWRAELDEIRAGQKTPQRSSSRVAPEKEGGMFVD